VGKENRELYFELDRKIQFLIDDEDAQRICGHSPSFSSFAQKTGVDRGQLAAAIGSPEAGDGRLVGDHKLSPTNATRIADKCGFDPTLPEWKSGTADAFKMKCQEHWRRQGMPTADVLLVRGIKVAPVPSEIPGLVSIEIDGAQFGRGTVDIEIIVSCGVAMIHGRNVAVRAGRVELNCAEGAVTSEAYRTLRSGPRTIPGSHGEVMVTYSAGSKGKPAFRLDSVGTTIGNIELEPGFLALEGLTPQSVIRVSFGTWLMDITEPGGETDAPADGLADGISLVRADGSEVPLPVQNLSVLKRKIIAALRKTAVLPDDHGFVQLATHELRFCKGEE